MEERLTMQKYKIVYRVIYREESGFSCFLHTPEGTQYVCVCTLPVCVYDAYAEPHSECVWLRVRPSLLYAGAHRRGIMERETNLLRSET